MLWLRQGHLDATYNLALMRAYGRGCTQDFQRALILFQKVGPMAARGRLGIIRG
jgi:TPR repeat protein